MITQVDTANSGRNKGWRSLDLTHSPSVQANGSGISRCLYTQQRSSSVPVQQNPSTNVLNTENQSPPMALTKVRNTALHFLITIYLQFSFLIYELDF